VRYGFDDVRLDRIIAQTLSVNAGSRAVMERAGLTYVRTFPTSAPCPWRASRRARWSTR
jgi:RimJ/RimL family protein N-acetyltransferase